MHKMIMTMMRFDGSNKTAVDLGNVTERQSIIKFN